MFLINDIFVIYNFINPSCVPETLREPPAAPARLSKIDDFLPPHSSSAHEAWRQ
jgi:hypothetical protein